MIKSLVQHGNSVALVIDQVMLQAAGLDKEKALFQITLDPSGGLLIRSVESLNEELHDKASRDVLKKGDAFFRRLADR